MKLDRKEHRLERRSRTDAKLAALAQRKKARESPTAGADSGDVGGEGGPAAKRPRVDAGVAVASAPRLPVAPVEPPNKILFVQNLPPGAVAETLSEAFCARAGSGFV